MEKNPLTPRQVEVLNLVAQGFSNREIAERLTIEETTTKIHLQDILDRLKARNRTHAAVIGIISGFIDIEIDSRDNL